MPPSSWVRPPIRISSPQSFHPQSPSQKLLLCSTEDAWTDGENEPSVSCLSTALGAGRMRKKFPREWLIKTGVYPFCPFATNPNFDIFLPREVYSFSLFLSLIKSANGWPIAKGLASISVLWNTWRDANPGKFRASPVPAPSKTSQWLRSECIGSGLGYIKRDSFSGNQP